MNLIEFAVKRPVAMTTIVLVFLVLGLVSFSRIGLDLFPKMDFPYVTISTVYPGASPEEIETTVTERIEDAVSELEGIRSISSVSAEGISQVILEFELEKNVDTAAMDVRSKIDLVRNDLPEDVKDPMVGKLDLQAIPVLTLVVRGTDDMVKLYQITDDLIRDQLTTLSGVANVEVLGGKKREFVVLADQNKLSARGLTISDLMGALQQANLDIPGGHITQSQREFSTRVIGKFKTIQDIEETMISTRQGNLVPITEVARVEDSYEEQRDKILINGIEGVGIEIKKRADANTVRVVDNFNKRLPKILSMLPPGIQIEVVKDNSNYIRHSVQDVQDNMIIGILLTGIILFLFLHSFRATIIAGITMPISIISTFILIYFAGFTINNMSLMALAISVGILVTNSIVVLENIFSHILIKEGPQQAAINGTREIILAVLGSVLTNVVVFVPIAFMSGIVGQFFRQFGLTVTFATLVSLFISLTLTPMLASVMFKKGVSSKGPFAILFRLWESGFNRLAVAYGKAVARMLRLRWLVILLAILIFYGSLKLLPFIGAEMMTPSDQGSITILVELPAGAPLQALEQTMLTIDKIVVTFPEVLARYATLGKMGSSLSNTRQMVNVGQMQVTLTDKLDRQRTVFEIQSAMRKKLVGLPDTNITVNVSSGFGGGQAPLQMEIRGLEFREMERLSIQLMEISRATRGAIDVDSSWRGGKPEIVIYPDRVKTRDLGLSVAQVAMLVRSAIEGQVASHLKTPTDEYNIRVKLDHSQIEDISQIGDLQIRTPRGGSVAIKQVVNITRSEGPTSILRKDKRRMIVVSANIEGDISLGELVTAISTKATPLFAGTGSTLTFTGQAEMMRESFTEILTAFGLAIIFTYLLLAALLESFIQPFTIIFTVPLALVGVFVALFTADMNFNLFSMMALVMLVGIVVNNAILILDYTFVLMRTGVPRNEALVKACRTRLRPIIMTSIATMLGMTPLALGLGWGSEMRAPMAVTSIGGVGMSSILGLFVIPVLYTLFDDVVHLPRRLLERFRNRKAKL
ncbi:MAG: efflux RND transporter permease subunit [bacterium]